MPLTTTSPGILNRFISIFRARDPVKREILQSTTLLEKMLRSLEVSRKNLETVVEEHKKRLKAQSEDKEMSKIIDDEVKNIYGYLSMLTKTIYDLTRVKYRLETLFYVEEPLKILPEILDELRAVEPVIEKINPQLINQIRTIEQRVASIVAMSSSYIPGITGAITLPSSTSEQQAPKTIQLKQAPEKAVTKPPSEATLTKQVQGEKIIQVEEKKAEAINTPVHQSSSRSEVKEQRSALATVSSNIPIHIVEQWLLTELKITGGILDLNLFEKKYGVSRGLVLDALRSLEAKNVVKVRRK